VFTSKGVKFGLLDKIAKFSFIAFFTRVSKSLGCFTSNVLKPSGLGVIDITLDIWVN
jgi:hypothetical protein